MNIKKLSFVNILFLSTLVFAVALSWTISRQGYFGGGEEISFVSEQELLIYPAKAQVKTIAAEASSPAPKVTPAPLPIIPPRILFQVLPAYPALALERGFEGTVLLRIFVSGDGRADKVVIKSSSGNESLDGSAIKAASSWVFEPAKRGAEVVASWFEVPVRYKIKN
jgi:TonB family protein